MAKKNNNQAKPISNNSTEQPEGIKSFIKDAMGKMGKEYSEEGADKIITHFNNDYNAIIDDAAKRTNIKDVDKFRDVVYQKYNINTTELHKEQTVPKSAYQLPTPDLVPLPGSEPKAEEAKTIPIDTGQEEEGSYIGDIGQSLLKGATAVSQGIVRLPSTIYRIAALPQNLLATIPGLEGLEVSKDKHSNILNFLDENQVVEYYDEAVEKTGEKLKAYEQSASEQWRKGDKTGALKTIGIQAAESIPLTALLMVSGGTGAATEAGVGIGTYATGQKLHELDKRNPDMNEVVKVTNSILTGATEAGSESMSMGTIGIGKKLLAKEGVDGLRNVIRKSFISNFGTKMNAIYNVASPMVGEGLTEAAATYSENYIDLMTGASDDPDMMKGVFDSFLVGTVAGGTMSAPIATYNEVVVNPMIRTRVKQNFKKSDEQLNDIANSDYVEAVKQVVNNHQNIDETKDLFSQVNREFGDNISIENQIAARNYVVDGVNYYNTNDARRRQIKEQIAQNVGSDGNVTLTNIDGQPYAVTNPQDLGQEGKAIFLKAKDGTQKTVISSKITEWDTQSPEDIENTQFAAQEQIDDAVVQEQEMLDEAAKRGLIEGKTVNTPHGKKTLVSINPDGTAMVQDSNKPDAEPMPVNIDEIEAYKTQEQKDAEKVEAEAQMAVMEGIEEGAEVESDEPLTDGSDIRVVDFSNGQSKIITPEGEQVFNSQEERDAAIGKLVGGEIESTQENIDDMAPEQAYSTMLRETPDNPEIAQEIFAEEINSIREQAEQNRAQVKETSSRKEKQNLLLEAKRLEAEAERLDQILADPSLLEEQVEEEVIEPTPATVESTAEALSKEYQQEQESTPYNQLEPWQQQLLGTKVSSKSFARWGDAKTVTAGLARGWFAPKDQETSSNDIDAVAAEITEITGQQVSEQDIIDFIIQNPSNTVRKTTDRMAEIVNEYRAITGKSVKKHQAEVKEPTPQVEDIEGSPLGEAPTDTPFRANKGVQEDKIDDIPVDKEEVPTSIANISQRAQSDLKNRGNAVKALNTLQDQFGVPIEIIHSDELSTEAKAKARKLGTPKAYYQNGKVYILSDQMTTVSDTKKSYMHEAILHKGLDLLFDAGPVKVLGKTYDSKTDLLDEVFKKADKETLQERADVYFKDIPLDELTPSQQREVAEEVLATLNETESPRLQVMMDKLYNFFKKLFGLTGKQFTKTDLRNMLREHRGLVAEQKEQVQKDKQVEEDVKFRATPSKVNENLVVLHNLNADNIMNIDKMGGLPVPSLAIARTDIPFTAYGDISLIADKSMVDPQGYGQARTFNADIYSPRYPSITYDVNWKKFDEVFNEANNKAESKYGINPISIGSMDLESGGLRKLDGEIVSKLAFLMEKGKAPRPKTRDAKIDKTLHKFIGKFDHANHLKNDPDFIEAVTSIYNKMDENLKGFDHKFVIDGKLNDNILTREAIHVKNTTAPIENDTYANRDEIRDRIANSPKLKKEYNQWIKEKWESMVDKEQIFKGHTPSGNRKYIPHTLGNVVNELTKGLQGEEGMFYGVGSVRSGAAKEFSSIEEIQQYRDEIVSKEDFEPIKEEINAEFDDILELLKKYYKYDTDGWGYANGAGESLLEYAKKGRSADFKAFKKDDKETIRKFLAKLKYMPTEYFESKVQRSVGLNEFKAAVVPKDTPQEVLDVLEKNNVNIKKYNPKLEGDRLKKVNTASKQEGVKFRVAESPQELEDFVKDSKVKETVYHGTDAKFDEFDKGEIAGSSGNFGHYGYGFYFSTDAKEAAHYGVNTINAKLDIKNPFTGTRDQYEQMYQAGSELLPDKKDMNYSYASLRHQIKQIDPIAADLLKSLKENGYTKGWEVFLKNNKSEDAKIDLNTIGDIYEVQIAVKDGIPDWLNEDLESLGVDLKKLETDKGYGYFPALHYITETGDYAKATQLTKELKSLGYDGVVYGTEVVAFENDQILIEPTEDVKFRADDLKDTKVADEEGEPMIVFHGTPKEFDEFSMEARESRSTAKRNNIGFFFTSDKNFAESWGKPMERYLDFKNPAYVGNIKKVTTKMAEELKAKGHDGIIGWERWTDWNTNQRIKSDAYLTFGTEGIVKPKEDANIKVEQASEETNTDPSEAQKESGNYKMGHVRFDGFDISIENPAGSIRSGVNQNGERWSNIMPATYGYFKGTVGADKDHIDVFMGDNLESDKVYVVDQVNEDGSFDESKVMMGYDNVSDAKKAYNEAYDADWQGLGAITRTTKDGLKEWFKNGNTKKAFAQTDVRFRAAFHGSPHSFDKFSTDFMGSGEGNQAFGWGLYFTDKESIARDYAGKGKQTYMLKGRELNPGSTLSNSISVMYKNIANGMSFEEAKAEAIYSLNVNKAPLDIKAAEILQDATKEDISEKSNRNLYKVKIHGDKTLDELNFVRWDKSLNKKQLSSIIKQLQSKGYAKDWEIKTVAGKDAVKTSNNLYIEGSEVYNGIENLFKLTGVNELVDKSIIGSERFGMSDNDVYSKSASTILLNAGIDGIQYPTEFTSKGKHDESFNYVVFDDKAVEIEEQVKFRVQSQDPEIQKMLDKLQALESVGKTATRLGTLTDEAKKAMGVERDYIKGQIDLIKEGAELGKADTQKMIKEVQKAITDYAKKALPLTEAGAREISPILTLIKDAQTPEAIEKAFERIDELAGATTEKTERKKAITKVNRLLKWMTGLKKVGTGKVGKFNYEDTKAFQELKDIDKRVSELTKKSNSWKATAEEKMQAEADMEAMWNELNDKEDKNDLDNAMMKLIELRRLGSKATSKLAQTVAEELEAIYTIAKDAKSEADMNKASKKEQDKEMIKEFLRGDSLKKSKWAKKANRAINNKTADIVGNWETIMTMIGGYELRDKMSFLVEESDMAVGKQETTNKILSKAKDAYKVKAKTGTLNKIHELSKEQYELRRPNRFSKEGEGDPMQLSQLHLMDIYNAIKNEEIKRDYFMSYGDIVLDEKGNRDIDAQMKSGEARINTLLNNLKPEDKQFADAMQEELDKYYDKANEVHIKLYNRDLPRLENYWPSTAERVKDIDPMEQYSADYRYASAMNERTQRRTPLPGDAFNKFNKHIEEMEWMVNMALPYKVVNDVLKDNNVRSLIESARGEKFMTLTDDLLTNTTLNAPAKLQQKSELDKALSPLLNNWVSSKIGATPTVPVKQLLSAVNYSENMPTGEWLKGFVKNSMPQNWASTWREMMKIPYLKTRLGDGYSEAIQRALNGEENTHQSKATNYHQSFKNIMTAGTRYGDIVAIMFGGKPYLDYLIKEGMKKEGAVREDVEKESVDKFLEDTLRSQQSPFASSLSKFQNSKETWKRAAFSFANTPSQYMRKLFEANQSLRVVKQQYKKGNATKDELNKARRQTIKAHQIYGLVNTISFTAIGSIMGAIMKGSDWDDELWKDILVQLEQTYIGGLPLIKDIIGGATKQALGMKIYDDSKPFVEGIDQAITAGMKLSEGDVKSEAKEYEKVGQGVATMLGVPYYNLKKDIKAIPPFREETFRETRIKETEDKLNKLQKSDDVREADAAIDLKKTYSSAKSTATRLKKKGKYFAAERIESLIGDSKVNIWESDYSAYDMKMESKMINKLVESMK